MITLIKRNLMLYFRDKTAVFFSLLSVFIVIGLYILFLAELQISTIKEFVQKFSNYEDIKWLVNCWIISGLLSIIPVTSSLGAIGNVVADKERKIMKDFKSSPIHITKYPIAAVLSSCIIGTLMSMIAFIIYSIYIYADVQHGFSIKQYGICVLLIILVNMMTATINGLIVSFFNTISSFTAASIVIGTIIGFITGVYVPVGILPKGVQYAVQGLPFGHVAVLFRSLLMQEPLDVVFGNVPQENLDYYKELYGIIYKIDGVELSLRVSFIYLIVVFFIATSLFVLNYSRKRKEI